MPRALESKRVSLCLSGHITSLDDIVIKSALAQIPRLHEITIGSSDYPIDLIIGNTHIISSGPATEPLSRGHAGTLHTALDLATGDYVLFSDNDIVYLSNVADLYVETLERHGLSIIGCAHYAPGQSYQEFPCVINCLVKRNRLPGKDFLKGLLRIREYLRFGFGEDINNPGEPCDGIWLAQSPIPEYYKLFPDPTGFFDVGCNLWLWNHFNNGSWLSFLPTEPYGSLYGNNKIASNCEIGAIDTYQELIWHKTSQRADYESIYVSRYE